MEDSVENVEAVLRKWIEAFNSRDLEKLVDLYTENALLFGSKPRLFEGRREVQEYFSMLPSGITARMHEQVIHAEKAFAMSSGFVDFSQNGQKSSFRLTLALMRIGDRWKIAQHHGSPRT